MSKIDLASDEYRIKDINEECMIYLSLVEKGIRIDVNTNKEELTVYMNQLLEQGYKKEAAYLYRLLNIKKVKIEKDFSEVLL